MKLKLFVVASGFLRFMRRHCDAELDALLSDTVPPIDLSKISAFRLPMSKYARQNEEILLAQDEQPLVVKFLSSESAWCTMLLLDAGQVLNDVVVCVLPCHKHQADSSTTS